MASYHKLIELENIICKSNEIIQNENKDEKYLVKGSHLYYHYNCDNINDIGWGCGYRTIQTMCSWIRSKLLLKQPSELKAVKLVPTLLEIQTILYECKDKPASIKGSREWIGCFEASIVIDSLYDVPCKILHVNAGMLSSYMNQLRVHFKEIRSPIMMGGDRDNASKAILGLWDNYNESDQINNTYLLIANPHFCEERTPSKSRIVEEGWVEWIDAKTFINSDSFYNFCMPQKV